MLVHDPALEVVPRRAKEVHAGLPVPPTPFLGRRDELAELAAMLESNRIRLLTLTGAGGSGKTRLALRTAELLC